MECSLAIWQGVEEVLAADAGDDVQHLSLHFRDTGRCSNRSGVWPPGPSPAAACGCQYGILQRSQKLVRVTALVRPVTELLGIVAFISILIPGAYMVLNETDQIAGIKLAARPLELAELATLYALLAGVARSGAEAVRNSPRSCAVRFGADRVFEVIDMKTMVPEPEAPLSSSTSFRVH